MWTKRPTAREKPILDSRLPDGSRVAAIFRPCSVGRTTLTIRRFQTRFFTAEELVRIGTMTPDVLAHVREAIQKNENILSSGGTSTGKTTLLNALSVPPGERSGRAHRGHGGTADRETEPRAV